MSRRFRSIYRRYNEPGIKAVWDQAMPDGGLLRSTADDPTAQAEDFNTRLNDLLPWVVKAMDMGKGQERRTRMLGVQISYASKGEVDLVLVAGMEMPGYGKPLVIKLPKQRPADDLQKALDHLTIETDAYLDGERAQQQLPFAVEHIPPEAAASDDAEDEDGDVDEEDDEDDAPPPNAVPLSGKVRRANGNPFESSDESM